jgi:Ca2+-transporting ATPase
MTLAPIVVCQDSNAFACRSERISIFRLGFFSNHLIWLGILTEWALILGVIYGAPVQKIFATALLVPWQWLLLLICPASILLAEEFRKKVAQ